jgi:PPM family protein phosphatase
MASAQKSPLEETTAELPEKPVKKSSTARTDLTVTDIGAGSDRGSVRQNNEDHYLVIRFGRSLVTCQTNLDESLLPPNHVRSGVGMMVADGLGGAAGGEVASSMALSRLVELLVHTPDWVLSVDTERSVTTVLERMSQRFQLIDDTLRSHAEQNYGLRGMGTTLTVAGTIGRDMFVGHVGDSRAYLLRGGELKQLTSDHTLAQAMVDSGLASPDDSAARAIRHILTRAIGLSDDEIEPQIRRLRLFEGDQVLLCTDGLTNVVNEQSITSVMLQTNSAQNACDTLIASALEAGAPDNVTLVIARFGPDTQPH